MKIAITQRITTINGFTYDALEHGWYNLLNSHIIIPVSNYGTRYDVDFDMLIISGGENSSARNIIERHYYALALEQHKPVLGVCHGAFFINEYFGGTTSTIKEHHGTNHNVTMENGTHLVNSYHTARIQTLGSELNPMATDKTQVEAFKHVDRNIWGLVWHPERMTVPVLPTDLKELLFG